MINPPIIENPSLSSTPTSFDRLITQNVDDGEEILGQVRVRLPPNSPPNRIIINPGDQIAILALDTRTIKSVVINADLQIPLPKGTFSAEICLKVDRNENIDDLCLAFYDEIERIWTCEDDSLTLRSRTGRMIDLCGTTNHFTNFAVLLVGGQGVKCDDCSSDDNYFTGQWGGDLAVSLSLIFLILVVAVIIIGLSYVPAFKKIYFGERGTTIKETRSSLRNLNITIQAN